MNFNSMRPAGTLFRWAPAVVLGALGVIYLLNGFASLLSMDLRGDLRTRWVEERLVLDHVSPYDPMALGGKDRRAAQYSGYMTNRPSGYPPWSFVLALLFVFPGDFGATKIAFATLNLIALAGTGFWAFQSGARYGPAAGAFLAASALAMFGQAITLRLGQYGILVNALLVLTLLAERTGGRAGLSFTAAMLKPNFALLFGLPFLVREQWVPIAISTVLLLALSLSVGLWLGTNPIEMLRAMLQQSAMTVDGGVGPLNVAIDLGISPFVGTIGIAIVCTGAAVVLMWYWRSAPTLTLFSIAAILGRLAFYHRQYDNVMLLFPLVNILVLALEHRKVWLYACAGVFTVPLWLPIRYADYTDTAQIVLALTWLVGLAAILTSTPRASTPSIGSTAQG